jgi:PAS domain S-box-containing protein
MDNHFSHLLHTKAHPDHHFQTVERAMEYPSQLNYQLRQFFGDEIPQCNRFQDFLNAISESYVSFEQEAGKLRQLIELESLENRKTAQRLQENEAYLTELSVLVPHALFQCILHSDGILSFPYISSGSNELFELAPAQIIVDPYSLLSLFVQPSGEDFAHTLKASASALSHWDWEGRICTNSGQHKWVKISACPRQLPNGDILWKGVFVDISEKQTALEEMDEQKKYYESFLNLLPIDLAVFDTQHRYQYVNPVAIKSGEIRKWIIGKDDFEYCRERGRDVSIAQERRKAFLQAIDSRQESELEEILKDQDGKPIYSIKRFFPVFNEDQSLKMVLAYGINITDVRKVEAKVKEKEELLNSINSNIQIGIFRSAEASTIRYLNQALADIFGFDSVEEAKLAPIESLYAHEEDYRTLLNDLAIHSRVTNRELLFRKKDGSHFWGQISCTQVLDHQQRIQYDTIIRDITELRQAEELLKEKNTELEKANAELDRFVYSASHELRAPLTSILGLISIAKMEQSEPNQLGYLNMMEQSVNRLDKFIREIVHYSRNSRLEVQKERVDFPAVIDEIVKDLSYIEGVDRIKITTCIRENAPFTCDVSRLKVIITNLISNAIRYHNFDNAQPYIRISVCSSTKKAVIQVEDNGLGISKEHQEKVFDMFYRASYHSKGSGIGLYIVKEMLVKLKGTIALSSEAGKGTTFKVEIPNGLRD